MSIINSPIYIQLRVYRAVAALSSSRGTMFENELVPTLLVPEARTAGPKLTFSIWLPGLCLSGALLCHPERLTTGTIQSPSGKTFEVPACETALPNWMAVFIMDTFATIFIPIDHLAPPPHALHIVQFGGYSPEETAAIRSRGTSRHHAVTVTLPGRHSMPPATSLSTLAA